MKNENGLTLIELLAVLSILLIISSLLYGVLMGVNKNFNQLSRKNDMGQQANIILATIKNYHEQNELQESDGSYKISYDTVTKKAYIGKTTANIPLQDENMQMEMKLDNELFSGEKSIDSSRPLKVYIKLIHKNGQFFEMDTIIKKY